MKSFDFSFLENILPDIIWRNNWDKLAEKFGLPYTKKYMANLDSKGEGPERLPFHNRAAYKRASIISWLNSRILK